MTRWRILATVSIWLVLCLSLWITDARPAVVALAGVVAVGAALVLSVLDVATGIGDTGWPRVRTSSRSNDDDRWVQQLRAQVAGARRTGSTELRDRLVALTDARLSTPPDTERKQRTLTPALRGLQVGSPRRLGSPRTLEQIITDIEAL
ncbi:MAG: hypothetical protein Q8M22_20265 [Actinomycetota bacterium]|nr:hypothetical protein [Actinomycetota bacterium]